MNKLIDSKLFESLIENGRSSTRRRANINFHDSLDAQVQRLFISMEPDSYVRPHYHPEDFKWEFFLLLRGELDFLMFSEHGQLQERITLSESGDIQGLEIPAKQWHSVVANQTGTVFLEVKQGPYVVSNDKNFAAWSPAEGDENVGDYLEMLRHLKTNDFACI